MAFIAGAVVIGGAALYVGSHDDYSRYREYTRHNKYGDAELRNQISRKENSVSNKESDVESFRRRMNENFNSRINELKREKNYSGLNSSPSNIISSVKADMRRELDAEISRDKQELESIDKMIARINEIELQVKRG